MNYLTRTGAGYIRPAMLKAGYGVWLAGATLVSLRTLPRRRRALLDYMYVAGVRTTPVLLFVGFFIGMIVALQVGLELARGCRLGEITASLREVAEGIPTTRGARLLAEKLGVDAPITRALYQVLFEERDPREAILELLGQNRGR